MRVLLALSLAVNFYWLVHPTPPLTGDPMFDLGGRRALLLPLLAGLLTWLSAGLFLVPRRLPAPLAALLLVAAALALTEADLRTRVRSLTVPHPDLFWELRHPDPVPQGEIDLLVLGDSTSWGALPPGVPREKRFSDLLARDLTVLNQAVPGYSTFQMARQPHPRARLQVLSNNNDWTLEPAEDRDRLPPAWRRPLYRLESFLCLADLFGKPVSSGARVRVPPDQTRENLRSLVRRGPSILMILPVNLERPDLYATYPAFRREDVAAYHQAVRDVAREEGVPLLDLFTGWPSERLFDLVHPDEEGHRIIARRLADLIRAGP